MIQQQPLSSARVGIRTGEIVVLSLLFAFGLAVVGITGYFRLSNEAAALRESALGSLEVPWNRKINVHIGFFTTGLVRMGAQFFKLPADAQAGINSIRGAEVGVYDLQGTAGVADS